MKKTVKLIMAALLCACVLVPAFCFGVFAVDNTSTLYFSTNTPKVGSKVTVTLGVNLEKNATALETTLSYDASLLEYIESPGTHVTSPGTVKIVLAGNSTSYSVSISFTAKASGSAQIAVAPGTAVDGTVEQTFLGSSAIMSITGESTAPPPENNPDPQNANANLKLITVAGGTLTPAFNKDITEYTVTVPHNITDGTLSCKVEHPNARLSFGGTRELAVGLTKRTITVTAVDGTKKVYTVTFNRLNEDGVDITNPEDPTVPAVGGFEVTIDDKKYIICDDFEGFNIPKNLTLTVYNYEGNEVTAFNDSSKTLTFLYLVDEQGKGGLYLYDEKKVFTPVNFTNTNEKTFVFFPLEKGILPEGFEISTVGIGEDEVPCYKYLDSRYNGFVVLRSVSPGGESGYYRYDVNEGTLQLYPEFLDGVSQKVETDNKVQMNSVNNAAVLILFFLAAEIIIAIIVIVIVIIVKSASGRKKAEADYVMQMQSDFSIEDNK